jgi:cell division protease FtsH
MRNQVKEFMMPKKNYAALPGYELAQAILKSGTGYDNNDLDDMMLSLDLEEIHANQHPTRPTTDDALNALLLLRLMQGHYKAGSRPMVPPPTNLSVIVVPDPADRKRLAAVIPKVDGDNLTFAAKPLRHNPCRPTFVSFPDNGPSEKEVSRFYDTMREDMIKGVPVIALIPRISDLPTDLQALVLAEVTLQPASAEMVGAILTLIHGVKTPVLVPRNVAASALSDLQLAQVFAANTLEQARKRLKAFAKPEPQRSRLTLSKVYGQPVAKQAFVQLLEDLAAWQTGVLDWQDVTSSFVFYGPPGTGKTLLAEALAGSAGVSFVKTGYAECQRNGHQGEMLKALYAAADKAIASTPAIFFIDEIDSFYSRSADSHNKYIIGVVNGFLTQLDRLNATPGVIIVAATNHLDMIDPAVIRSGRFDRHIPVEPLDRAGVNAMLKAELPDVMAPEQLAVLGNQLLGHTGAKVAAVIRDGKTRARQAKQPLAATHLMMAAAEVAPVQDAELQRRIALHEAGHLVMGHLRTFPVPKRLALLSNAGYIMTEDPALKTPTVMQHQIEVCLAGRAAESLFFPETSHGGGGSNRTNDLAQATMIALQMERNFGFGGTLSWCDLKAGLTLQPKSIQDAVEARLQLADAAARSALRQHMPALEHIAQVLLRERELDRNRLELLLGEIPVMDADTVAADVIMPPPATTLHNTGQHPD